MVQITLKRSYIGVREDMRRTLQALGLRKIGMTVVKKDLPSMRGMIKKISHLVDVKEI